MVKRNVYLDNMALEEALERFLTGVLPGAGDSGLVKSEELAVDEALGRITAGPVFARISTPHYHASAMDGFAVKAVDTVGARETRPLSLEVGTQAFLVDTGDPLPEGCDAVVMIENVNLPGDGTASPGQQIEIIAAVAPWQHVRPIGEDVVATEMILPANHKIGPYDLGALLAGGLLKVEVKSVPRVGIIPTGTELVPPGTDLKAGDIIEFNSRVLGGLVSGWGGQPNPYSIVIDDYELIKAAITRAVQENDVVIINAGSSAGSEDFTSAAVAELGQLICHGVAIKPGKPVILGLIEGKPVIGVPGYPVSAALTCELFVRPLLEALIGVPLGEKPSMEAVLSRQVVSPLGQEEFVRIKCGQVGDKVIATPMARGAGIITSLVKADGMLRIPRLSEGYRPGTTVNIELLRRPEEIAKTTVVVGSHDLVLDILANRLAVNYPGRTLSSAHVGSLGGLMAIRRGETHLAGIHLLDPDTGEYNVPYLGKYLGNRPVVLVNLVHRDQGLIVPKGNPAGIKDIRDLAERSIPFINRQKGAGTRVLLDYYLDKLGIPTSAINGYEREEFTHLSVAAAVAGGSAGAGMGILAAARALDLDFVPIDRERYDLLIPGEFWDTPYIQLLLELMSQEDFKQEVTALGGYYTEDTGRIFYDSRA